METIVYNNPPVSRWQQDLRDKKTKEEAKMELFAELMKAKSYYREL